MGVGEDTTTPTAEVGGARPTGGEPTLIAENCEVTYRVYADKRPTFRELLVRRFKPREYTAIRAVRGISFTAYAGEAIGVIGPNGSGKSTLMGAIAGLLPVTGGRVWARSEPALLGVGAALQPALSGRRNIILGGLALGLTRKEIDERLPEIIEFCDLGPAIDLPLKTYSSGMRARLHFALASSIVPDVLIIDEALAVGDKDFRKRSQKRISKLRKKAGTVFLVSHSMKAITDTCTRVLWLEDGQLRADGPAEDIVKAYGDAGS